MRDLPMLAQAWKRWTSSWLVSKAHRETSDGFAPMRAAGLPCSEDMSFVHSAGALAVSSAATQAGEPARLLDSPN